MHSQSLPDERLVLASHFGSDGFFLLLTLHKLLEGDRSVKVDGIKFVPMTLDEWAEELPWLSRYQVHNVFKKLRKFNIVKFAQFDKKQWSRRGYWAIDYDKLKEITGLDLQE